MRTAGTTTPSPSPSAAAIRRRESTAARRRRTPAPTAAPPRWPGTCTDRAGNVSSPFGYGLKYDATAPLVTGAEPERPANANGWFNRPVAFTVLGTDATSGVADMPVSRPTADRTRRRRPSPACAATGPATPPAARSRSSTTPPRRRSRAGRRRAEPTSDGWYNRPVSVAFSGTDQTLGRGHLRDRELRRAGQRDRLGARDLHGQGRQRQRAAGLRAQVRRDRAHGHRWAAGAAGRRERLVQPAPSRSRFAGTDPVSGVDSCTSTTYGGPDSATASVAGTCTDKAGNHEQPARLRPEVRRDLPAGDRRTPQRSPDANGWYNRAVAFDVRRHRRDLRRGRLPGGDLHGPDSAHGIGHRPLHGPRRQRRRPGLRAQVRRHRADGRRRHAGPAAQHGRLVQPPGRVALRRQRRDRPGSAAARRRPTRPRQRGRLGARHVHRCRRQRQSGPRAHALKYDATAPAITGADPARPADANGWYNRSVSVAFGGTDQTSGVDACTTATLQRAGQRHGLGARHVRRQGRQRQRPAPVRPQVRRDRTGGDRGRSPSGRPTTPAGS